MTIKKAKNKIGMYLHKSFGVSLPDAYKMGKVYARTFSFSTVGEDILDGLAQEAYHDESLKKVMSKYFDLSSDYYYDEYHEESVWVYSAVPKCL